VFVGKASPKNSYFPLHFIKTFKNLKKEGSPMETVVKEKGFAKKEEFASKTAEKALFDLIEIAVEKGDTSTLEKLIELKEQSRKEIAKNEFFKALHGFQSELQPIKKSNVVYNKDGSIRYKYATFDDIVKSIHPLLKKYGLTFHFKPEYDKENQTITVHCIITHVMGHQEVATFKAPLTPSDKMQFMQAYGSILTYAKRYSLSLALGLATEEDENMHEEEDLHSTSSTNRGTSTEPKIIEPKAATPNSKVESSKAEPTNQEEGASEEKAENKITESQKKYIINLLNRNNLKTEDLYQYILSTHGKIITSIDDLTKGEASRIIDALKNWTAEKKVEDAVNEALEDIPF
jgi:hypothetical protein